MPSANGLAVLPLAAVGLLATAGCFVPASQLNVSQSQNRLLTEKSKALEAEIANLRTHQRQVEDQLAEAERQLATLDERAQRERQRADSFAAERARIERQLAARPAEDRAAPAADPRLERLGRSLPVVRFDPETGVCKLQPDLTLSGGESGLAPDARAALAKLAAALNGPDGKDLRLVVIGHPARDPAASGDPAAAPDTWHLSAARAVADYVRQQGLDEARVGVAGYGRLEPVATNAARDPGQLRCRVEVFVVGPETPIVGWQRPAGGWR